MDEKQRVRNMRDHWKRLAGQLSAQTKDKIGTLYVSQVLGLGPIVAKAFVSGDTDAYHEVGIQQSGISQTDTTTFWQETNKLLEGHFSENDLNWLVNPGGVDAVFFFLLDLNSTDTGPQLTRHSRVLHDLQVNAHAYK